MSAPAPVALFAYNRLRHTRETLFALQANTLARHTDLVCFCDGARDAATMKEVHEVREFLRGVQGFKSVRLIERGENRGLANSIIAGVTEVCDAAGRVIVVEDDLVTTPSFLQFMNDALDKYENDNRVGSIHGYWYPAEHPVPETFFLRGASCWGWATWSRGWRVFDPDGRKLLAQLCERDLTRAFDLDGAMPYTRMLEAQVAGRVNSWAIRWHASTFLAGLLQLSPGRSLVRNIGFDGSGTHCDDVGAFDVTIATEPVRLTEIPVEQSTVARAALIHYYRATRPGLLLRVARKIRRALKSRH